MKNMKKLLMGIILLVTVGTTTYELAYRDRIYPGVRLANTNVGNKDINETVGLMTRESKKLKAIEIIWGTSRWQIAIDKVGLEYDTKASASKALGIGRSEDWISDLKVKILGWRRVVQVDPVFALDENQVNAAIADIVAQVNIPAKEPEIQLTNGVITISNGLEGQEVDERELVRRIRRSIALISEEPIELPVRKLNPTLDETALENLRQRAGKLVGKMIIINLRNQKWEVNQDLVIVWLEAGGWKKAEVETWVEQLARDVDRPAQNAHFRYVGQGKVEEFKPALEGMQVEQEELTTRVIDTLNQLENGQKTELTIEIPVVTTKPEVATDQVNNLGIKELIGQGLSDYSGSIPNRVFNVKKAAEAMNGILVAPGEIFSFSRYIGDISAQSGYKQAYVIKEGKTVLGDGGGVCQVSTTLFRAALNTGLPIEERTAHAYRVHYYENDSQPGIDATVFTPSVDLKFKNDTPAYILIQTRIDESKNKLYFDLYGTNDGRKAEVSKVRLWDSTPPPPDMYQDDTTLTKGVVKQVDWSAWGIKAAFDWKVTRNGEVLQQRTFYSNYRSWQAVYLRGTK